uniref:Aminotransferase-like plant mobile domain-containing protein n=1 Tax=Cucumis melo TaxID=3656 RepID=A0A9I9EBH4_CUCME
MGVRFGPASRTRPTTIDWSHVTGTRLLTVVVYRTDKWQSTVTLTAVLSGSAKVVYTVHDFLHVNSHAGTYAWGAATLAWLYRKLCRASNAQFLEIAGPLMLLQVWAYDRFSIIAPQRTLQHSDGRPLSFRWSGVQAASEQSGNMLLIYRWTFDRLSRSQVKYNTNVL